MTVGLQKPARENIFLRMHPIHRILLSAALAALFYFILRKPIHNSLLLAMSLWDVFALTLSISGWIVFLTRSTYRIREIATREDGSLVYIFMLILVSCCASMFTVLLLIISKEATRNYELFYLGVAIAGMLLSWVTVHTTFAFHYAHMFYDNDTSDQKKHAGGLDFPGEKYPDYRDFAYFSFVIGMTFQVSDVTISSRQIRHFALFHSLLSFALNTFVVALTINMIAGLKH